MIRRLLALLAHFIKPAPAGLPHPERLDLGGSIKSR
jgi:hypothetical protein